ncbi:hypothetical protein N0V90_002783 [Kalmusia sp. IMI 367209]|nr:hypothetical protein N0V90_002783 [Kalmusia sp. IMI 367209]
MAGIFCKGVCFSSYPPSLLRFGRSWMRVLEMEFVGSQLQHLQLAPLILVLSIFTYFAVNEWVRYQSRIKHLPHPGGWPVVGNLFQSIQLRNTVHAETYRKWAQKHGDVFQIQLGNTTAVVVNSAKSAKALFLGQSHAMNSRPKFYVFHGKVSKAVTSIGTSPWDESCKRRRKAAAGALNRTRVESYALILNLESREFLKDILDTVRNEQVAVDFRPAVKRFALNLSLTPKLWHSNLTEDPLLNEIVYVESEISRYRDTSKNYANYLPILRYWDPIASFLGVREQTNHAAEIGRRRLAYNGVLLNNLRREVEQGTDKPCIQGAVVRDPEAARLTREELISVSLSMMAGADSNQPTLAWAILLLAHRPELQEKAYAAIHDAGILDLPSNSFASTRIAYIDALTKEISRYFVVLKLALPKATYTDVEYNGALIPANTMVFLNAWACNRGMSIKDVRGIILIQY